MKGGIYIEGASSRQAPPLSRFPLGLCEAGNLFCPKEEQSRKKWDLSCGFKATELFGLQKILCQISSHFSWEQAEMKSDTSFTLSVFHLPQFGKKNG